MLRENNRISMRMVCSGLSGPPKEKREGGTKL